MQKMRKETTKEQRGSSHADLERFKVEWLNIALNEVTEKRERLVTYFEQEWEEGTFPPFDRMVKKEGGHRNEANITAAINELRILYRTW